MPKRAIGIEINRGGVSVVQIALKRRGPRVEIAARKTVEGGVAAAVREALAEGGFRRGLPVGLAFGSGEGFFRCLASDLPSVRLVRRTLGFELEDAFPVPVGELVLDVIAAAPSDSRRRYLVGAVRRETLDATREAVEEAGGRPAVADTSAACLRAAALWGRDVAGKTPVVMVGLGDGQSVMCVTDSRSVCAARHMPPPPVGDAEAGEALAREVEMLWRSTFDEATPATTSVALCIANDSAPGLAASLGEALGLEVVELDLLEDCAFADAALPGDCSPAALGAAIRAAVPVKGGMDFLEADRLNVDPVTEARRGMALPVALVVLLAAAWGAGLFLRLRRLEGEYRTLKRETRKTFAEFLPGERRMVNPVAQVAERLTSLRKERDVFAAVARTEVLPLRVLNAIGAANPRKLGAVVTEIRGAGNRVQIRGTIKTLRALETFKKALEAAGAFDKVRVSDVDAGRPGAPMKFTLTITPAAG